MTAQSDYSMPLSKVIRNQDGTVLTIQVDTSNQRVEENLKDANGALIWKLIRELDEDMQPVRGVKFDAQDQIVSRHKYLCLRGRMEEEEVYDARNNYLAKMVYYYDSKGRRNRIDHFNASGKLVSTSKATGGGVDPVRREVSSKPSSSPSAPR